jgi:hypothetical protein
LTIWILVRDGSDHRVHTVRCNLTICQFADFGQIILSATRKFM